MKKNSELWVKRGQIIRKARESKNLLQSDIANILKVGISAVSDYENGRKRLDFDSLKMLCKFLDIDIRNL